MKLEEIGFRVVNEGYNDYWVSFHVDINCWLHFCEVGIVSILWGCIKGLHFWVIPISIYCFAIVSIHPFAVFSNQKRKVGGKRSYIVIPIIFIHEYTYVSLWLMQIVSKYLQVAAACSMSPTTNVIKENRRIEFIYLWSQSYQSNSRPFNAISMHFSR